MSVFLLVKSWITSRGMLVALLLITAGCSSGDGTPVVSGVDSVTLGRKIFFDENLSSNANQSCASCHDPVAGFADPDVLQTAPVSAGSVVTSFGNRNAPTSAYASFSPDFRLTTTGQTSEEASKYEGGQFLDGRSVDLVEQAKAPFLNPVEMNNTDAADVVAKVQNSAYADDFITVFGAGAFDNITTAYNNIAAAIAAFEDSSEMNPFTSKFDAFQNDPGSNPLTASELRGFNLFRGSKAKCANCHVTGGQALFTNFKYFNIGVPSNPNNPDNTQDLGLGAIVSEAAEEGKFKVPTLRNIELTAPYMHNGVYATLEDVVRHYDIQVANEFITPEVNRNIAPELNAGTFTGLGLSTQESADLVAFMKTLTDR
jgi:cytochrome c peroxidase